MRISLPILLLAAVLQLTSHGGELNTNVPSPSIAAAVMVGSTNMLANALSVNGADPNCTDEAGETPLHAAARMEQESMLTMLIEAGADVNHQDEEGETPLFEACLFRRVECVKTLLAANASPHVVNQRGQTALDYCTMTIRPIITPPGYRNVEVSRTSEILDLLLFSQ